MSGLYGPWMTVAEVEMSGGDGLGPIDDCAASPQIDEIVAFPDCDRLRQALKSFHAARRYLTRCTFHRKHPAPAPRTRRVGSRLRFPH